LAILTALVIGWVTGRAPVLRQEFDSAVAAALPRAAPPAVQTTRPITIIVSHSVPPPEMATSLELPPLRIAPLPAGPAPPVRFLARAEPVSSTPAAAIPVELNAPGDAPAPIPAAAPPIPTEFPAHGAAAAGYAALATGERRAGAHQLETALALNPAAPNAPLWQADLRALRKHWSFEGWALLRDAGAASAATAAPVLGGGQAGATIGYTLDPLARRPVTIIGRYNVAASGLAFGGGGYDRQTTQFAAGVAWRPNHWATVSAERLIAGGAFARDDWAARLALGGAGAAGPIDWRAYGEAGIIGLERGDSYAGGLARAGWRLPAPGRLRWSAGAGAWASVQSSSGFSLWRADLGPSLAAEIPAGALRLETSFDWRFRVAGNAAPGSGPALTLVARY
jgi:hypothetical protein